MNPIKDIIFGVRMTIYGGIFLIDINLHIIYNNIWTIRLMVNQFSTGRYSACAFNREPSNVSEWNDYS